MPSIIALLGLDLAVPDQSTLSRRAETLEVPQMRPDAGPVHLLVDSTGLEAMRCGGMAGREARNQAAPVFNGRVGSEVLGITISSHRDLEQLLRGFNTAYNDRRQRVLDGKTPNQVTAERLKARRKLVRRKPEGRAGPDDIAKARAIVEDAKEISQPDSGDLMETSLAGKQRCTIRRVAPWNRLWAP